MNNIFVDHELVVKLGSELKPHEPKPTHLVCIRCDVEVPCFAINEDTVHFLQQARAELARPCELRRK